jgi:hypothetical protein
VSKVALIRFGLAATPAVLLGNARRNRTVYDSLRMLGEEAPVFVDHEDRQIGVVRDVFRMDDTPLRASWWTARVEIDDAPEWLSTNTPASVGFAALHRGTPINGWDDLVRSALVTEVSVLSPGVRPAEPLAKVVFLREHATEPEGEVFYGGPRLTRYFETTITVR